MRMVTLILLLNASILALEWPSLMVVRMSSRLDVGHSGWCDFGDCFYAVQSFRDDDGRRIAIGWLADHSGVRREAPRPGQRRDVVAARAACA
ncbi:MAG: hypothetical protein ACLUUF_00185 [Bifidobacterium pullorum]